jgi:hypothetical protein
MLHSCNADPTLQCPLSNTGRLRERCAQGQSRGRKAEGQRWRSKQRLGAPRRLARAAPRLAALPNRQRCCNTRKAQGVKASTAAATTLRGRGCEIVMRLSLYAAR